MTCEAKIIADSISEQGVRLTTLQLRYWRAIHSEFLTHRVFSRNASSSRAIPVRKVLSQVWNDPAGPIQWGSNKPGMQAGAELTGWRRKAAKAVWRLAGKAACVFAWGLMKLGLHKQVANRLLEPWQYISVVLTSTEWDNFFALRAHPKAQPEIQELAYAMTVEMKKSLPKLLKPGEWHLPYILDDERPMYILDQLKKMSAARCARVSYLTHDKENPDSTKDIVLCDTLVCSVPAHASPVEHQATPDEAVWVDSRTREKLWAQPKLHGNLRGWIQYRKQLGL